MESVFRHSYVTVPAALVVILAVKMKLTPAAQVAISVLSVVGLTDNVTPVTANPVEVTVPVEAVPVLMSTQNAWSPLMPQPKAPPEAFCSRQ